MNYILPHDTVILWLQLRYYLMGFTKVALLSYIDYLLLLNCSQYINIGRDCEFSRFTHAEVGNAVSKLKCGKAAT